MNAFAEFHSQHAVKFVSLKFHNNSDKLIGLKDLNDKYEKILIEN